MEMTNTFEEIQKMLIEESEVESTDHFEQAEQSPLAHTWNSAVSEAVKEVCPVAAIVEKPPEKKIYCQKTKTWVTYTIHTTTVQISDKY